MPRLRLVLIGAATLVVLGLVGIGFASTGGPSTPVIYNAVGGLYTGVRPTAVGLPQIGESGTVGASELTATLKQYHDSGAYENDLAAVDGTARRYLNRRLALARGPHRLVCIVSYQPVRLGGTQRLFRQVRHCRVVGGLTGKPAIVLDIDETSLSNYAGMAAGSFTAASVVTDVVAGTGTAITPTLQLYSDAHRRGVAVFFVTGRPSGLDTITQNNLRAAGYNQGWQALYEKPSGTTTEAFKSSTRAMIQRQGYDIIVNVGDQESDLDGGHADRAFKLPNPFYFIADS